MKGAPLRGAVERSQDATKISPKVLRKILGPSDVGMTMNTYSHVVPELRLDAAARMDEVIRERER